MSLRDALAEVVAKQFDEQVEVLSRFVQIPSQRRDAEGAQDLVAGLLRARSFVVDRWALNKRDLEGLPGFSPVPEDYTNMTTVVGALRSEHQQGRSLIIQGHTDVVPVGPFELWDRPAYSGVVEDNWMYGRGAGDMKAGLIAGIYAVDALRGAGFEPASDVYIQSVLEEESTGNGALSTIQRGYRAEGVLISEPSGLRFTRAQVGVIWFRLRVVGKAAHASHASQGNNAIESAFAVFNELRQLETEWTRRAATEKHFEGVSRPINLNLGKIAGGDWASSVPAWCEMDLRIGLLPSQDPLEAREEIRAAVARAATKLVEPAGGSVSIEWNGFLTGGYVVPEDSSVLACLQVSHRAATGLDLIEGVATGLSDTRIYAMHGMDAVIYGPRAIDIHNANERVELSSIKDLTLALALFIAEWCGLRETS